jgi:hypothetical protein
LVAAPLLAGFSLTLAALSLQLPSTALRWPDELLLLLIGAALAFMTSVQAAFWARSYFVTRVEAEAWWSDGYLPSRQAAIQAERCRERRSYNIWANRCRRTYAAGILLLLGGMALLLVTPEPFWDLPVARLLAVLAIGLTLTLEIVWLVSTVIIAATRGETPSRVQRLAGRLTP